MNLITRLLKSGGCIILVSLVFIVILFLLGGLQDIELNNLTKLVFTKKDAAPETENETKLTKKFIEISPDGTRQIILYEKPFAGSGELDYRNYLSNQYLFTVKELDNGREHDVFAGDYKVGYPHWLDNNFIFFTAGCGTGCRGIYLVDTRSKESYQGTITTTPISQDGFKTHFHDWFDQEFKFVGWGKNIRSVYLNGKAYLIFEMWNNKQYIGEKRFLFTGDSLKEQ